MNDKLFTPETQDELTNQLTQAVRNIIETKMPAAFKCLQDAHRESTTDIGEVTISLKCKLHSEGASVGVDGFVWQHSRKVGERDAEFEEIEIDTRQLQLGI
uniref:Uncharacterized protein n=1 Tax=viral metagenome TaxID=1070528 RepID=A0A6M3LDZ2_9ZZZZ